MEPTLKHGQLTLFSQARNLQRGNIILFAQDNRRYVKRIIGKPNEIVEINETGCKVNNKMIYPQLKSYPLTYSWNLNEDQYIVLGDNLSDSLDSRKLGPITRSNITHIYRLRLSFSS